MSIVGFTARRLAFMVVQVLILICIVFVIVRVVPGNPAYRLAGPAASKEQVKEIERQLGINRPITSQFVSYVDDLAHGNLGVSTVTSDPVSSDIEQRFPATFELITVALIIAVLISLPVGVNLARHPRGLRDRISRVYGLFAGALPEYWWGLMIIYVFFFRLHWAPGPTGQLDPQVAPPDAITHMYVVDSAVTGNWTALKSSMAHLVLPVATLVLVYMGPILKMTRESMSRVLTSDYIWYARAVGVSPKQTTRVALRNALPPVVTMSGIIYAYLISGAVLVETVFGWGGLGQYAVQAAVNSDFSAIQGVVLVATVFALLIYLVVDISYFVIDRRARM